MKPFHRSAALLVALALSACEGTSWLGDHVTRRSTRPVPDSPPADPACWAPRLTEVQPRPPKRSAADLCASLPPPAAWSHQPQDNTDPSFDARERLVGRWILCSGYGLRKTPHTGIEFGSNGRWRLLTSDPARGVMPVTGPEASGHYYLLSRDQFNLTAGGIGSVDVGAVWWATDMDLARFESFDKGSLGIYARTQPSPLNGRDNTPSVTDGNCSMVGTWNLAATAASPSGTFSFDEAGNFIGGPLGTDLCANHTMYGTYKLTPGLFQLTENVGMTCEWWFDAGYRVTFSADCNQMDLAQSGDNCTGLRRYFNGNTVLTRRR